MLSSCRSMPSLLLLLLCVLSACHAQVCHVCGNPKHIVRNPTGKVSLPSNPFIDLSQVTCQQIYNNGKRGRLPGFACDLAKTRPEVQGVCDCGPDPNAPPSPSPPVVEPTDTCAGLAVLGCVAGAIVNALLGVLIAGWQLLSGGWQLLFGNGGAAVEGDEATRKLLRVVAATAVQNNN